VGLDSGDHICYNLRKEVVKMEEKTIDRRSLSKWRVFWIAVVAILLSAGVGLNRVSYTQVDYLTPYLETLAEIPIGISQLALAMKDVNDNDQERSLFMENPRQYLAENRRIPFSEEMFRLTSLDFDKMRQSPAVFGFAELRGSSPVGIGLFFQNVGLIIQPGFLPTAAESVGIESYLTLLTVLSEDLLSKLYKLLNDLNSTAARRSEFVKDPRGFLKDPGGIVLSEDLYRLVALDFAQGANKGAFVFAELSDGASYKEEGVGIFYDKVGLFIQIRKES